MENVYLNESQSTIFTLPKDRQMNSYETKFRWLRQRAQKEMSESMEIAGDSLGDHHND